MRGDEQKKSAFEQIAALERDLQALKRSLLLSPQGRSELSLPLDALVLRVSGFMLALPVGWVEEVTPMVFVSPLPRAPAIVRGTISYRHRLVPVLDLSYALSGALDPLALDMFLAVVSTSERMMFALSVDQVVDVRRFGQKDLDSARVTTSLPSFVHCLLRSNHQAVALLDPEGLLAAGESGLLRELLSGMAKTSRDEDSTG